MITFDQACIHCGRCAAACPNELIAMAGGGPRMKNDKRCMACMHCAAACPKRAVHLKTAQSGREYPPMPEDALERLVKTRRSVRHYKAELPPKELIEWALDTAEWAPSGHNEHTHSWMVLWGKEATDAAAQAVFDWARATKVLPELVAMERMGGNAVTCGAPCILLCHAGKESPNHTVDAALATATVELLLASRGLGTCWAGYLARLSNVVPALVEKLALPEGHQVRCALMVGLPDGTEQYKHVPYRPEPKVVYVP